MKSAYESIDHFDKLRAYAALNRSKQEFIDDHSRCKSRYRPLPPAPSIGINPTASEYLLDIMQVGIAGIAADGTIIFANAQARSAIQAPTRAVGGRHLPSTGPYRQLLQQVLADNTPHGLSLLDDNAMRSIITAFPAKASWQTSLPQTAVMMVFSKPGQRSPRPSLLIEWFGLSAAEARLAHALAAGSSVEQYAATFSISVATARTQLRSILKKTGMTRQQELVRVLASIVAP